MSNLNFVPHGQRILISIAASNPIPANQWELSAQVKWFEGFVRCYGSFIRELRELRELVSTPVPFAIIREIRGYPHWLLPALSVVFRGIETARGSICLVSWPWTCFIWGRRTG
jgi:hypothetical protein